MKSTKKLLSVLLGMMLLAMLTSCTEDGGIISELPTEETTVSDEEVTEIVEASLAKSTGGAEEMTTEYSEEMVQSAALNETCDSLYQQGFRFDTTGVRGQAAYDVNWAYTLNCNNFNIPQSADATLSSIGSYSTLRIDSNDSTNIVLNITGLQPATSTTVINGVLNRMGTQVYTSVVTSNSKTIATELVINLTNITIDKNTYQIQSGTATFSITGTVNGTTFTRSGSIVFLGNMEATLDLNGMTYQIDLS